MNKDNMNDRDKKCRGNSPKGSSHYTKTKPLLGSKNSMSKLDEMSVIEIRKLRKSGITLQNLSKMFNISQSVISSICSYKAWGHVP
jgi:DNA-binding transcriptional regulator YiaG